MKKLFLVVLIVFAAFGWSYAIYLHGTTTAARVRVLSDRLDVATEQVEYMSAAIKARKATDTDCAAIIARTGGRAAKYHRRLLADGVRGSDPVFQ
jgi:hypothetical protein